MLTTVLLLALAVAAQADTPQRDCDTDCVAILTAAVEWAMDRLEGTSADITRTFIDTGQPERLPPRTTEGQLQARAAALAQIGPRLGIAARDKATDPGWLACHENRVEACRAAAGMRVIWVRTLVMRSEDMAGVTVRIDTLSGQTTNEAWSAVSGGTAVLNIGRGVDGEWHVDSVGLILIQ